MPTFSFLIAPEILTYFLLRRLECSPTTSNEVHSFGSGLDARLSSTQRLSTSELLRTL